MATGVEQEGSFDAWIAERFRALNTDETVFAPYVKSIVEGEESLDEKIDALDGILSELADGVIDLNVEVFRQEILERWDTELRSGAGDQKLADIESKLENILRLSDQVSAGAKSSQNGGDSAGATGKGLKAMAMNQAPDSDLRAAILNQYRDDDSEDDSEGRVRSATVRSSDGAGGLGGGGGGGSGVERNMNAERVANELKDKREREKAEAAKKRERDKEDRAKQKQQAQDRKDKAKKKAAKVERKR